jgi:hypothetical protein
MSEKIEIDSGFNGNALLINGYVISPVDGTVFHVNGITMSYCTKEEAGKSRTNLIKKLDTNSEVDRIIKDNKDEFETWFDGYLVDSKKIITTNAYQQMKEAFNFARNMGFNEGVEACITVSCKLCKDTECCHYEKDGISYCEIIHRLQTLKKG